MSDLELFRQAINEGFNQRIDKILESESEEISCSKKHEIAMRAIIRGKVPTERKLSKRARRIIIIAALLALLLASCAVIYRDEIGKLSVEMLERYDLIIHSDNKASSSALVEIYELTYLPEGFQLEETYILPHSISLYYFDTNGNKISFYQNVIGKGHYHIDNENGGMDIFEIGDYSIYYRQSENNSIYMLNNDKYVMTIISTIHLTTEELSLILEGIKIK